MIDQETAARDLRAIRSLMERATIYRTISGPTALIGAFLAVAGAAILAWLSAPGAAGGITRAHFLAVWLAILALSAAFNFALIHRDAARRGEPFASPGMRLALRTIAPPMAVGGILGVSLTLSHGGPAYASIAWILCYGLALCATSGFAPRSIKALGAAFLISGAALLLLWHGSESIRGADPVLTGSVFMGGTFGLLHLVYGLCIGIRITPAASRHAQRVT